MAFSSSPSVSPREEIYRALSGARMYDIGAAASRAASGEPLQANDLEYLKGASLLLQRLLRQDVVVPASESNRLAARGTIAALRVSLPLNDPAAREGLQRLVTAIEATVKGVADDGSREQMSRVRDVFVHTARLGHEANVRNRATAAQGSWPQLTNSLS